MIEQQKNIAIYQSADGKMQIDVHLQEQTIWLSLDQISSLFQKDKSTISRHIKNVFLSEELDKESLVANFRNSPLQILGICHCKFWESRLSLVTLHPVYKTYHYGIYQ